MANREFILTAALIKWYEHQDYIPICEGCKQPLKIGDVIHSRSRTRYNGDCYTVHYHVECWQRNFINAT